jgi:predicted DNA-binding transcriptional regulator AlpA
MTTAQLIESIIQAPPERHSAILAAARGDGKPQPITARDAAEALGVCPRTVQRWGTMGILHPIKIGPRLVRFDRREIEALAAGSGA